MKESDLNKKAMDYVLKTCPQGVYYKIADRFTKGIPDSIFTWNARTSWLEFKLLDPNESIHDQLDPLQLVELVKLHRTGGLAWVIAFRRPRHAVSPKTVFYHPPALLHEKVPTVDQNMATRLANRDNILQNLRSYGVAEFEGFDYAAVAALIHQTHEGY